jgi:hypothetical protein
MAEEKQPVELTRGNLYKLVWETPMTRLAHSYGITGNGLAKICDRLKVPYPPRGYWAKIAAGKQVITFRLPDADADTPQQVTIKPTPPPIPPRQLSSEIQRQVAAARDDLAEVSIPQRLSRPHPIVAGWLADHERRKIEARNERDPWRKKWMDPGSFSENDRRRHRILDALFKSIERQGGHAKQDDRQAIFVELLGQPIEFQLREKLKQVRRPLNHDEKQWQSNGDKGWRKELQPTGMFILSIKTYIPGIRREWLETKDKAMEDIFPDIVATFISAGPVLVEIKRKRDEEAQRARAAEQRRYEKEQHQKREKNRWREFNGIARQWRDTALAREFVAALKLASVDPEQKVGGLSLSQWFAWVDEKIGSYDPVTQGVEAIFGRVSQVTEWTQRD